ncbi:HpcH/HpaI aldolase/citrate lyase family protein [Geodermatophilus sp. URMC 62]|uniref:HpcH/HpaI aldolase/citrate lyase family protein n=1 Tax=Geodermatophilus sp. URMC 62 TaxID=3423414 RepID=UPI00406D0BA7
MLTARSHLFVPGTRADLMTKADRGPADVVVVDLEDAVPLPRKEEARETLAQWLASGPAGPVWVRLNPAEELAADLAALRPLTDRLAGVLLAKAEEPDVVAEAASLDRPLGLFLETAGAVLSAAALARLPGVTVLHLGEYDLAADAGLDPGEDEAELAWARAQVVFASAAARLAPPPAPVSTVVSDTARFLDSTLRAARQGFVGRMCIHPSQVLVVNDVFTPDAQRVADAEALLQRYDQALARGAGVLVDDSGRMVDEAVVRSARRVLAMSRPGPSRE